MKKGDVVLVPFPFTDLSGYKLRPALVLISKSLDIVVTFISTNLNFEEDTDIFVKSSHENGLKKDSIIRLSKIATMDKGLILGRIGNIEIKYLKQVDSKLMMLFKITYTNKN